MKFSVEEVFALALEKEGEERELFLAQACGDDAEFRLQVQSMLVDAERAEGLFGDVYGEDDLETVCGGESSWEEGGEQIGPYQLKERLGEGGFGVVWRAEQEKPIVRTVALKVVKAGMDTEEVLHRFDAERQALALMDHPNIAKVLDAGATDAGRPYFVMELVKGTPITRFCDAGNFGIRQRLDLFREVCSAVNHAHQKGIIHRDLKPSNVLVTVQAEKPVAKVIDFGIAKATQSRLTEKTLNTRHGQFVGTPVYMSPEQAAMDGSDIDTRSDIYSLGVLLYELLSGRPPFDSKSLLSAGHDEMRRIIREVDPPKLSSRVDTVVGEEMTRLTGTHGAEPKKLVRLLKGDLEWIVMKALEKERARRYETANDFAQDIGRFLASEPVEAGAPSALYKFRKFARRNKAALGTAFLFALVLVVATVVSTSMAFRAKKAEQVAIEGGEATRRQFAKAQVAVASAAFRDAERGEMIRALESVPEDLRDQSWQYLAAKLDSSLGPLDLGDLGAVAAVMAVPGSPAQFAVAARSGKVVIVDVRTGERVRTVDTSLKGKLVLAFNLDGSLLAITASRAPKIHLVRVADGTLAGTLPAPSNQILQMCFSPEGKRLATRDGNGKRQHLTLMDLETRNVRWQVPASCAAMSFSSNGDTIFTISMRTRKFHHRDAATGEVVRTDPYYGNSLAMSPDGKLLAIGLHGGEVVLLDAESGRQVIRRRMDLGGVTSLAWTARGHLLTLGQQGGLSNSARGRRVLRLWDTEGFAQRGTFFGMELGRGKGGGWTFQPESGFLLTKESPPQLWHIPVDLEVARLSFNSEQGWAACFLDDKRLLGRKHYGLAPYDVSDPAHPRELPTPARKGESICSVNWQAELVATAYRSTAGPFSIKLYSTAGDELAAVREIPVADWTNWLDFDRAGRRILAVSKNTRVYATGTGEHVLTVPQNLLRAVFAGTRGNIVGLLQRTDDDREPRNAIAIFDGKSGEILKVEETQLRLSELVTSPDRRWVAIAGGDAIVRILDADTLEEKFRFRAHDGDITAMAFHPTEPVLATASTDGSVKIWDYETARVRKTFYGIDGRPVMLAFSPKGTLLALESQEAHLRIFDLRPDVFVGEDSESD